LSAKYPFLACNPTWLEKANFLWENEKMPEFYEGKEEKNIREAETKF
jgi:hypothetical protein